MAQPIDEPALRNDLHPRPNAGRARSDPHEAEVGIVKCLEDSPKGRRLDLLGRGHGSDLYLRTTLALRGD